MVDLGLHSGTCAHIFAPWGTFVHLFGTLGDFGAPVRYPWAPFGRPGDSILMSFWHFAARPGSFEHFLGEDSEKVAKNTENGSPKESIFNEILSFCKKWQTAFGLRLRGRIRVLASCFHSLGLPWRPWIFQCFFDVFWGPLGALF